MGWGGVGCWVGWGGVLGGVGWGGVGWGVGWGGVGCWVGWGGVLGGVGWGGVGCPRLPPHLPASPHGAVVRQGKGSDGRGSQHRVTTAGPWSVVQGGGGRRRRRPGGCSSSGFPQPSVLAVAVPMASRVRRGPVECDGKDAYPQPFGMPQGRAPCIGTEFVTSCWQPRCSLMCGPACDLGLVL